MMKSFKFRIYPTAIQERKLLNTLELCRQLYNGALDERKSYYKTYGKFFSLYEQERLLPTVRELCPEYKDIYAQLLRDPLRRLDRSFSAFFKRIKSGDKPGYPRYKSSARYNSFTYSQLGFWVEKDRIRLSKIGSIKMRLHRDFDGNIKTCRIQKSFAGKWYVDFSAEICKQPLLKTGKIIGIDLGIKNYIVSSDNQIINKPKTLNKHLERLAKASRRYSKKKSNSARLHRARVYERISNANVDWQHKVTNKIVKDYDIIILEKLNIQKMKTDSKSGSNIKRSISDASWYRLIQFISYKAEYADKKVVLVDPANTSKMCSRCGNIKENLSLSDRIYECDHCGLKIDRDYNASLNIKTKGLAILAKPQESRNILSAVKARRLA